MPDEYVAFVVGPERHLDELREMTTERVYVALQERTSLGVGVYFVRSSDARAFVECAGQCGCWVGSLEEHLRAIGGAYGDEK